MGTKELLHAAIDAAPEEMAEEVYDFLAYLKLKEKKTVLVLAESALKKDWLSAEEDAAWQNL